jgi:hypothetical protein
MINYHKQLINSLSSILPTYYKMILHKGIKTPCISYLELNNAATATGDTLGYSSIQYQVKVWGDKIGDLQTYAQKIDNTLRPLGWKRIGCRELYDKESTMIQKIMTYEANALEVFEEG